MIIKQYSLGEEIANSITHGVGAIFSIIVTIYMATIAYNSENFIPALVYGLTLILLYTMSTMYHAISNPTAKHILQAVDHSSIYLLIAGTYTPYALITLKGTIGLIVFAIVWGIAIFGIILNIISVEKYKKISLWLYIISGWTVFLVIIPLVKNLAPNGLFLMLFGGFFYMVGIIFYKKKSVKYFHSIWHLFVLAGSVLQYFSIVLYVL